MSAINFQPFPVLNSDRLLLKQLSKDDEEQMFQLRSNPEIMKYIPRPLATSVIDAAHVINSINDGIKNNNSITWGIFLKPENKLIGTIGYVRMNKEYHRGEVGYLLDTKYQGMGIMKEALDTVLDYGFNVMKLHSVEAVVHPENKNSIKLLERNGFKKEGYFRQNQFYNLKFHDSVSYALLAHESSFHTNDK